MKSKLASWLGVSLFLLVVIAFAVYLTANRPKYSVNPTPVVAETPKPIQATPESLLKRVNEERVKAGVAPLIMTDDLNKSAQMKADDEYKNHYSGHVNPTTGKHGYTYIFDISGSYCSKGGENIAEGFDNVDEMVSLWMQSPPHRMAILDSKYTETGFGIAGKYVVEHFCQT